MFICETVWRYSWGRQEIKNVMENVTGRQMCWSVHNARWNAILSMNVLYVHMLITCFIQATVTINNLTLNMRWGSFLIRLKPLKWRLAVLLTTPKLFQHFQSSAFFSGSSEWEVAIKCVMECKIEVSGGEELFWKFLTQVNNTTTTAKGGEREEHKRKKKTRGKKEKTDSWWGKETTEVN